MCKNAVKTNCFAYDPKEPGRCKSIKALAVNGCEGCRFFKPIPMRSVVVPSKNIMKVVPQPSKALFKIPGKRGRAKKRVILMTNGARMIYPDANTLAVELGISIGTIYNYLRGSVQNPRFQIQYENAGS